VSDERGGRSLDQLGARSAGPRGEQKTLTADDFSLRPPETQTRAVLVRLDAADAGRVIALDGPELRIGRRGSSGLVIDDEGLSRSHARISQADGAYRVEDLGSSNGTYVNGVRVDKLVLGDGMVLQLGPRVCFRFSLTDGREEELLRRLYEASVRDALTGDYNRHYLGERLSAELAYAARHNSQLSIVMFDVDHFKRVNDQHGHLVGDAVLRTVAGAAERLLRQEDLLARYGGEEFLVLLRGVALEGAERAGERLREAVEASVTPTDTGPLRVTVSVGCASLACAERLDAEALIAVADRRLYAAKAAGRNRVVASG